MFISSNNMKGLVVDLDSFPGGFDGHWVHIDSSISILFLSRDEKRLSNIEQTNGDFLIHNGSFDRFFERPKSLVKVHQILEMESYELAVLSQNLEILKYLQGMNVSTIYFSQEAYSNYKDVGNLPDFLISRMDDINHIISGELKGFFSEAVSIIHNGKQIVFKQGVVIVTNKEYQNRTSTIVSGGRYFSKSDIRYPVHQLSQRIIRNKDYPESQVSLFSSIYNDLVRFIEEQIGQVNVLTRIPPRPSQDKDRMRACVDRICGEKPHIRNAARSLVCIRDYESQKFLNQEQRLSNIQGVFEVTEDFDDAHVVIIDDVISTGATALEAANEFYKAGVRKVTILVLAINQFKNNLITSYQPVRCQCGGEMKMRFNRRNNSAFFGCNNYPTCKRSLDFFAGMKAYNHLNKVEIDSGSFEDPEWF